MAEKKLFTMLFEPKELKEAKKIAKENYMPLANFIKCKLFKDKK